MKKDTTLPPRFPMRIFRAFCDPEIRDSIEGDLIELYRTRVKASGRTTANLRFFADVALLFRPGIIKPIGLPTNQNHTIMFRNYFKIGFRNILKYKTFSFINIFGLALAMSISMLILMMLAEQNSSDQFHEKKELIFRVLSDYEGSRNQYATSPQPLAAELAEYPAVETTTKLVPAVGGDITFEEKSKGINGHFADPEFFEVFSFELESGNPKSALAQPYSMVVSQELASFLFRDQNPVGKTVQFLDRKMKLPQGSDTTGTSPLEWGNFTITGVIDQSKYTSHLEFDVLVSSSTMPSLISATKLEDRRDDWKFFFQTYTYALLSEGKQPEDLSIALDDIVKRKAEEIKADHTVGFKMVPQALGDVALGLVNNDSKARLPLLGYYFLIALALVILASACLNYTNLSIARALTRAKEIGIRKVTGALRKNLVVQFLSESILTALLSLVIAFILLLVLVPSFKGLWVNQFLNFKLPFVPSLFVGFILLAIIVGILAGIYPALFLSGYQPIKALKSLSDLGGSGKLRLRKFLGVSQFVVSLFFITTSILIYSQFKHYMAFDYGFKSENIVNISLQGMDHQKVRSQYESISGVSTISACDIIPATGINNNSEVRVMGDVSDYRSVGLLHVDRAFHENLGIELVAGSGFSENEQLAQTQIIVNQAMVKDLGHSSADALVGLQFESKWGGPLLTVVGVAKDFRYKLLLNEDEISPMMMKYNPGEFQYLNVKVASSDLMKTVAALESQWKELDPVHPFSYQFLDEEIEATHRGIFDVVSILGFISFLAIFIACLGLLGMTTYTAERKTKEVGIRKFLGADSFSITLLLSKGYLQMLAISVILGAPLSYFINKLWLENLPNRVEFGLGTIALGSLVLLLLGALTISSQTVRVSRAKFADTLKVD
ncbi:ABC transporter permease [Algoriphagus aestuariicola]|uniref:ABC transporter permease n=1 Tax=Algoriphagus aestuariicola TaxID=1852016 RepID=A0ABS3BNR9_9BACT|nr:ABC transporter permease [Algoriphagus aestuariicola]MBN7800551.1 ABC transporter permease [Algoriphagus aestuariicola]